MAQVLDPENSGIADVSRRRRLTFRRIRRSHVAQCVAALLLVLVVLPFTAPFAAFDTLDLSTLSDVTASAKSKVSAPDALASPLSPDLFLARRRIAVLAPYPEPSRDPRLPLHTVLRL